MLGFGHCDPGCGIQGADSSTVPQYCSHCSHAILCAATATHIFFYEPFELSNLHSHTKMGFIEIHNSNDRPGHSGHKTVLAVAAVLGSTRGEWLFAHSS